MSGATSCDCAAGSLAVTGVLARLYTRRPPALIAGRPIVDRMSALPPPSTRQPTQSGLA